MDNLNYWPSTNIHELNLDWIIAKVKELDTRFTDDIETFVREYIDEHFAEWTVNANYDPDDETIIYTNGTGATLTAGDVIRFAIDNAFVNVKDTTARTAASNAQDTADDAAAAAAAAQDTADDAAAAAAAAQDTADDAAAAAAANSAIITNLEKYTLATITQISGASVTLAVNAFAERRGKMVNGDIIFTPSANISSWTPFANINLIPDRTMTYMASADDGHVCRVQITNEGIVQVYGANSGLVYYSNINYFTSDY